MRVLGYWFVRAALFFCVVVALYAMGWRNWTEAIGAFFLSWLIAYALFGSQHDWFAQLIERFFDRRRLRRNQGKAGKR